MIRTAKLSIGLLCVACFIVACIKEPTNNSDSLVDDFDRKTMLENLSTNFIRPGYAEYLMALQEVDDALVMFEQNPSLGSLDSLRQKYVNGLSIWQSISFLDFGPAASVALHGQSNIYPVDTVAIWNNMNTGGYDLALAANFTAKGWQALDYLLFSKSTDIDNLSYLISSPEVITYLKDLTTDLILNASYVSNAWNSYHNTFVENDASNATGSAVSEMTNGLVAHYESAIRKGKVGLPVGIFNGFSQAPMPYHCEAYFSHAKLEYANTSVRYLQRFLNGTSYDGLQDGLGLLDYANFVGATVDSENLSVAVNYQIDKILAVNQNATLPWSEMVQQYPTTCQEIYLEYQKLIPPLKVDLTSALGIIITYQDNDGD